MTNYYQNNQEAYGTALNTAPNIPNLKDLNGNFDIPPPFENTGNGNQNYNFNISPNPNFTGYNPANLAMMDNFYPPNPEYNNITNNMNPNFNSYNNQPNLEQFPLFPNNQANPTFNAYEKEPHNSHTNFSLGSNTELKKENAENNLSKIEMQDLGAPSKDFEKPYINNLEKNNEYLENKLNNIPIPPVNENEIGNNIPIPAVDQNVILKPVSNVGIESRNCELCIWYLSYHAVVLAITIPLVVLVFMINSNFVNSELPYFAKIGENWNSKLATSINLNSCLNDTSKNIINDYWPGTKTGCNCYSYVRTGSCGRKSICTTIGAKSRIQMQFWRGVKFCRVSDFESTTYFDLKVESSADKCPSGTRSCGLLDSQSNHLCVENNKLCPIINMKFYNSSIYDSFDKSKIPVGDTLLTFPNGVLIYSNNEKNYNINSVKIPIDFKISNDQPCLNPYYENMNYPVYILDYYIGKQQCKKYADKDDIAADANSNITSSFVNMPNEGLFYDTNFQLLDKEYQETLYNENGITQITFALPLFPKTQYQRDIYLFAKNYFGIKIACIKDLQKNNKGADLIKEINNLSSLSDMSMTSSIVMIILSGTFILMMFLMASVINSKTKKTHQPIKVDRCMGIMYIIFAILTIGFLLGVLICSAQVYSRSAINPNLDKLFRDPTCVDDYSVDLYLKLLDNIIFMRTSSLVCLILSIILMLLLVIYSIIVWVKTGENLYS